MTDTERQEVFLDLLRPHQKALERFCLHMTRDRESALDLLQDTLLVAWRYFDSVRDHAAFKSWVFTICSNTFKRKFTRSRFLGLVDEEVVETLPSTEPHPDTMTDNVIIRTALAKLPPKYREALVLFELNGLSVDEIRRIQGGTASAVKLRLMRGRTMLAKALGVRKEPEERPVFDTSSTPLL